MPYNSPITKEQLEIMAGIKKTEDSIQSCHLKVEEYWKYASESQKKTLEHKIEANKHQRDLDFYEGFMLELKQQLYESLAPAGKKSEPVPEQASMEIGRSV